jgi:hypothetical protein
VKRQRGFHVLGFFNPPTLQRFNMAKQSIMVKLHIFVP